MADNFDGVLGKVEWPHPLKLSIRQIVFDLHADILKQAELGNLYSLENRLRVMADRSRITADQVAEMRRKLKGHLDVSPEEAVDAEAPQEGEASSPSPQ